MCVITVAVHLLWQYLYLYLSVFVSLSRCNAPSGTQWRWGSVIIETKVLLVVMYCYADGCYGVIV